MKNGLSFRTVAVVALLLPGLVTAAPVAGPCGLCGNGDGCHMQRPPQEVSEAHSCCDSTSRDVPRAPTLGSSSCECGRDVPAAVTAEWTVNVEQLAAMASSSGSVDSTAPNPTMFPRSGRPPAPPPEPPAYLIDCAYLI